MKRVGFFVSAALLSVSIAFSASVANATTTVPTQPVLVDGPFVITAYSFSGHSVHYIQVANTTNSLASLDGWKIRASSGVLITDLAALHGFVAPGKKITVANGSFVPTATFLFHDTSVAAEPFTDTLTLIAPQGSGFNNYTLDTTIKTSTVRDTTTSPATFYVQRNISSTTGSYLSTLTAYSVQPATLESDPLYVPPEKTDIQIVEVYPNAKDCSPVDDLPSCHEYVKIFNPTTKSIDLGEFRLRTGTSSSSSGVALSGDLPGGAYIAVHMALNDSGNYVWLEDVYGQMVYGKSMVHYPSASSYESSAWSYNSLKSDWEWTNILTPTDDPNQFPQEIPVNICEGVRLSEIAANYDPQFIELYNPTSTPIDLSGCLLQTNRSQTVSYSFPSGTVLSSGGYLAVPVSATPLTLTKTTTGTVYFLSSDGKTEVDSRSYENLDEDTSLALVDGVWRQTFSVTAGVQNGYQQYPPCEQGYFRNESTGLCNKVIVADMLASCAADEYRNTETNRCRKLVTVTSSLTPCGEGQERNPATNRCRSIASAVAELLPCDEGYERNPATNRCRKVAGVSTTATGTPTSLVEEAKGSQWNAWTWALVAVGAAGAVGYGVYEWRSELLGLTRKIAAKLAKK